MFEGWAPFWCDKEHDSAMYFHKHIMSEHLARTVCMWIAEQSGWSLYTFFHGR